jgi:hypothetical protein
MSDAITRKVLSQELKGKLTYRQYLTIQQMINGSSIWVAIEAVSSVAIEHPEWDMEEEKNWKEWEDAHE